MWMAIGGGITFIISIVVVLTSLLPTYSMVGCVNAAANSCGTSSLGERSTIVHIAALCVKAAIAVVIAGAIVMLIADAQKEIRDKK